MPASSGSQSRKSTAERLAEAQAEMARLQEEAQAEAEAERKAKEERKVEEARRAEAARKAAEEARKRAAEGSPEVEEVEGPKKKKAKKGKGKGKARADEDKDEEEEESGQKKPVVLVASSVACDPCWRVGAPCLYQQGGKHRSCFPCSSKKAKCEMDGHPSNGPTLAPSQQAGGSGRNSGPDSPLNRHAWSANLSTTGQLTGEELLNTLLVEVQHLRRDHARTQEVLRDARADVRELQDSFYFLRLDRNHLRERQAALDAYLDRLGEEMSEAEAGDEEFAADLSEPESKSESGSGEEAEEEEMGGDPKGKEGDEGAEAV
ncbi:hypothetical protein BV20DRAFT_1057488 [Pilatotrama ljubarskyi]|nr:hypothetical protein BV20DRAFT_1057488 [Pilatotrama ljubarskyi]